MEFRELLGLGKELRALLIPVFVGMRLGKELEFSLGWFLGKLRLPDPGFSFGSCRGKVGKRIPRDRGMVRVGKASELIPFHGRFPLIPTPSQPHFLGAAAGIPAGKGLWELGIAHSRLVPSPFPGNCSFPAHSQPFSQELLIPSPYPWIWRFPGSLCPLEDIPDPLEFPGFPTPKIPSLGPSPSPGIPWMSPEAGKALGKGLE